MGGVSDVFCTTSAPSAVKDFWWKDAAVGLITLQCLLVSLSVSISDRDESCQDSPPDTGNRKSAQLHRDCTSFPPFCMYSIQNYRHSYWFKKKKTFPHISLSQNQLSAPNLTHFSPLHSCTVWEYYGDMWDSQTKAFNWLLTTNDKN